MNNEAEKKPIEQMIHNEDNILEVSHLKKYFPIGGSVLTKSKGYVKAVDDVSFNIKRGTTMGLVGESGCGKSTAGRTILRLIQKTEGTVLFNGTDVNTLNRKAMNDMRTKMQIIFQDPYSALNPFWNVREIINEPLKKSGMEEKEAEESQRTFRCMP